MDSFPFPLCLKFDMFVLEPVCVYLIVALILRRYGEAKQVMLALLRTGNGQSRELSPNAKCKYLYFSEYYFIFTSCHIDETCKVASNALVCKLHRLSLIIVTSVYRIHLWTNNTIPG